VESGKDLLPWDLAQRGAGTDWANPVKNIAWDVPSAELVYFIGIARQRQGYASESIRAISRLAFLELEFQRIFVRILPSNRESFLLARKLGFHEEGVQRKAFRCGLGQLHDVKYLSLTTEDNRNHNGSAARQDDK
jgi:RimJ/RimL family protein N-acetyltransferase